MKRKAFLPLVTYPDAMLETCVAGAVAMASHLDAELEAIALEVDIPEVSNALSRALLNLPEMIRDAKKLSERRGAHLIQVVRTQAAARSVPFTARVAKDQPGLIGDLAAEQARYLDIALAGIEPGNDAMRMVAEAMIFGSGRPTILLPPDSPTERLDHIVIAWDGSRAAARAVADARLAFERASGVTVLTVTDEKPLKEKHAGERLAANLQAGGLKAGFEAIQAEDAPIAETLQRYALENGAGLLVMGGYGHSRLRDFVLGGATQGVLDDLKLPVLLAH